MSPDDRRQHLMDGRAAADPEAYRMPDSARVVSTDWLAAVARYAPATDLAPNSIVSLAGPEGFPKWRWLMR